MNLRRYAKVVARKRFSFRVEPRARVCALGHGNPRKQSRQRAAALIVVLSVILLLTVLVVTFTVALRMDRQAAHFYAERMRADAFAREGVESVKGILAGAIGATNRTWVSMPGRVLAWTTNQTVSSATAYNLFSADDTGETNAILAAHDFNPRVLTEDSLSLLTGEAANPAAMKIGWIYVLKDGTRQTTTNSTTNNPVIGRFAFWTDDESSRIDLNTAWRRQTNVPISHPGQLPLQAISPDLSDAMIDDLHAEALRAGFNSPDEARRIPGVAPILSSNRFSVTHYSHSSDLNPFGQPKIYLTTQLSNLPPSISSRADKTNYFLDILKVDNTDPGDADNIDAVKYKARLTSLRNLLAQTNWPNASGSFSNKYGGAFNAIQMAADIIGYVRSAESTNEIVGGIILNAQNLNDIRTSIPNDPNIISSSQTNNLLVDTVRRPMLCEIGVQVSDYLPAINRYGYTGTLAFYLPPSYGISASSLEGKTLTWLINYEAAPDVWLNKNIWNSPITAAMIDGASYPNFAVVTCASTPQLFIGESTNRPTTLYGCAWLTQAGKIVERPTLARYNLAPNTTPASAAMLKNNMISCPVNATNVPVANIMTVKVNDPRMNKYGPNWNYTNTATWGSLLPRADESSSPRQDKEGNSISDAGLVLRAPKGHALNPDGKVASVAELGFIRTGGAPGINVPWRSVALRPTPASESPPDWLLLDMFAAPVQPTNNAGNYLPDGRHIAGRINLNSAVLVPFTNTLSGTDFRFAPLKALFLGTANLSLPADQAAQRVGGMTNFVNAYGPTNYYASIGKLAEVAGIGSANKSGESILREVVDQTTVQGNVFRIHAVGQALKQTPSGQFLIQAERSIETIMERDGNGKFHVVYWRALPL